jgi:hypothetical protein
VTVLRNGEDVETTLAEVSVGEQVLTFNHANQIHTYETITDKSQINDGAYSSVLFEIGFSNEGVEGSLTLTPGHYVYLRRDNGAIQHVPSEDVQIGDEFLYVHPTSTWVQVVSARAMVLPTSEVV